MCIQRVTRAGLAWLALAVPMMTISLCTTAQAGAIVDRFTVQVRLDRDAAPVSGSVDLRLRTYAAADGGSALTSASFDGIVFQQGLAAVRLAGSAALPVAGFWVEVEVAEPGSGAYQRLAPRIPVGASPLARAAARVRPAAVGAGSVQRNQVQLRVAGCPSGLDRLVGVSNTGAPLCVADQSGVQALTVTPGLLGSMNGSEVEARIDPAHLQRRVAVACAAESSIAAIGADGLPQCAPDARITSAQLQAVSASCDVDPTLGVITQCSTSAFCPPTRPLPVSVGFGNNCVGSRTTQLVPTETPMGIGFVTRMIKDQHTQCSGTPARHTLYLTCAAVE
jgi:hypothetical protein